MEERSGPWYGAWWVWPWFVVVGLVLVLVGWAVAVCGHLADGFAATVVGIGTAGTAIRGGEVHRRREDARARRLS